MVWGGLWERIATGASALAMTEGVTGVRRKSLPLLREVAQRSCDGGRENYPSVKNQRFLPAPLTRGAFGVLGGGEGNKMHLSSSPMDCISRCMESPPT